MSDWTDNAALDRVTTEMDRRVANGNGSAISNEVFAFSPADLAGRDIPEQPWIVSGWIPAGTVTQGSGSGGEGKSLIADQLAASRALGRQWFGLETTPGRTLIVSAEDDADVLHRRFAAIRDHYGCAWADLEPIQILDFTGADAVLCVPDRRSDVLIATDRLGFIADAAKVHGADLVVLDAQADVFGGDEIRRSHARQFISLLRRHLCQMLGGAGVLLLSHPSLQGQSSGTGGSGSTGWANSVRSRLLLDRAKASNGSEPDPDLRRLSVVKANYASLSEIRLRWKDGVFVREGSISSLDKMAREKLAEERFLSFLTMFRAQRQDVSHKRGPTFAPTTFAKHPDAGGVNKDDFEASMQRLLSAEKIKIELHGPQSKERSRLVLADEGS